MKQCNETETVCSCNKLFDEKTLHPLVSVIDMSCRCKKTSICLDCYSVMLRKNPNDNTVLGQCCCDFSDAVLLFRAPGKDVDVNSCSTDVHSGRLLVFHPDLLSGTSLGCHIADYTFFRYLSKESLHLSSMEMRRVQKCLDDIEKELQWGVDVYSVKLITGMIETLLNYCRRFYTRQFVIRTDTDKVVIDDVVAEVDSYMLNGKIAVDGMPVADMFAGSRDMSAEYLNDMLLHHTGKRFDDYVELRRFDIAKQLLVEDKLTDSDISAMLGYSSETTFCRLFRRVTGTSTSDYRM